MQTPVPAELLVNLATRCSPCLFPHASILARTAYAIDWMAYKNAARIRLGRRRSA
jgi:hypothetical protein